MGVTNGIACKIPQWHIGFMTDAHIDDLETFSLTAEDVSFLRSLHIEPPAPSQGTAGRRYSDLAMTLMFAGSAFLFLFVSALVREW